VSTGSGPAGAVPAGATAAAGGGDGSTFEQLMEELEELTAKLAAGDLGIEAAADLYERAERLHARATERLDQVRTRVEGLTGAGGGRPQGSGSGTGSS
jgi:exodeoxyribonuclease VII small subunit